MAIGPTTLVFPRGGLHKGAGLQFQPPYTYLDGRNVRSRDPFDQRERGGSRPGSSRAFAEVIGDGTPVRMIYSLPTAIFTGGYWKDDFEGALQSVWSATAPVTVDAQLEIQNLTFLSGTFGCAAATGGRFQGNTRIPLSDLDQTQPYDISLDFLANAAARYGGELRLYALLDNSSPAYLTDGLLLVATPSHGSAVQPGGLWSFSLFKREATVSTLLGTASLNYSSMGTTTLNVRLRLAKNGSNMDASFFVGGSAALITGSVVYNAGRHRIGLALDHNSGGDWAPSACVNWIDLSYTSTTQVGVARRQLLASAGQEFWTSSPAGVLSEHANSSSGAMRIADDRPVMAADRAGDSFIADHGTVKAQGSNGVITGGNTFDSASYAAWQSIGLNENNDVLVIGQNGSNINHNFTVNTGGANTLSITSGTNGTNLAFTVQKAPKVYKSATGGYEKLESGTYPVGHALAGTKKGHVPIGCKWVRAWNDRILWGGDGTPNWYASRQGDGYDYDYAATGARRAMYGGNSDAGQIGDEPLDGIPGGNDYFIFACKSSMWILRGDPAQGGRIDNLSHTIGIVCAQAWCFGSKGEIYFLSADGLYVMAPGGGIPVPISNTKIPADLMNVSAAQFDVKLDYDFQQRGVRIFLTPKNSSNALHYFFGPDGEFHPDSKAAIHGPTAACSHVGDGSTQWATLEGGRDGYIRKSDPSVAADDGVAVISYVMIGAFKLGSGDLMGVITRLVGILGAVSGSVAWEILVGDTPEAAQASTAIHSGTWVAGRNYATHPRARGGFAFIKITGTGTAPWALESIMVSIKAAGVLRKL